ncbi:hypothetical protein GC209_13505 [bacterium]|nr:hypothetical protein [bacterium]
MAVKLVTPEPGQADVRPDGPAIEIGPFTLYPERFRLVRGGEPVRIGSRALSILIALVKQRGALVSKEALIAQVWPETFVEESNLRVHITALRKVLGDPADRPRYIANVSGRGYRFIAATPAAPPSRDGPRTANLTRLIGRDTELARLTELVARCRLVTISGPGGIGKTSVAFAALRELQESFEDGIVAVDLGAAAADESGLPQAIAMALRVSVTPDDGPGALATFLAGKNLLLVLDNCEHIIGAVTRMTEFLLREAPRLHILATSTEPMRAEGEWVFRLPPLDVPSEGEKLGAEALLAIPGIALFVERAEASLETFQLKDADVPLISEICRRLDGNPLAIEIAAASLEAFGLKDLAEHLDARFEVLVHGRRTAAPRHQTLRNLLDWSHGTLAPSEQATLRRLSIFRGAFTLEAARFVAAMDNSPVTVINDVASLVRKSLLSVQVKEAFASYRLLDSTRTYARQKASEAHELTELNRRHANYFESLLERADADWCLMSRAEWIENYGLVLDDARAATDWAWTAEGNTAQAVRLTARLLPLGYQFALMDEMDDRVEKALARASDAVPRQLLAEIRLNVAYSGMRQSRDVELLNTDAALERAIELARESGNLSLQAAPLIKYATHELTLGRYAAGLAYAERAFDALTNSSDDLARLGADRVLAQATNMSGDHTRAVAAARRAIAHPAINIPLNFGTMQVDHRVSMRVVLARSLWLQGFARQAKSVALDALSHARKDGPHAVAVALGFAACPVAIWSGFDEEAEGMTNDLLQQAERYTLNNWRLWAEIFDMVLARRRGDLPRDIRPAVSLQADTLVTFDPDMLDATAMERAMAGLAGWANPEMLRAMALRMLKSTRADRVAAASALLDRAMDEARQQTALAWELRIAITMAEMHRTEGRPALLRQVLEPVYERLTEGHNTWDALHARSLLEGHR